jgi:hypothetical protein
MEGLLQLYNPLMTSYLFPFFLVRLLISLFNLEQQGETPRALASSSPSFGFGIEIHLKDLPGGIEKAAATMKRRQCRQPAVKSLCRQQCA